jgi:hypothetical protein
METPSEWIVQPAAAQTTTGSIEHRGSTEATSTLQRPWRHWESSVTVCRLKQ